MGRKAFNSSAVSRGRAPRGATKVTCIPLMYQPSRNGGRPRVFVNSCAFHELGFLSRALVSGLRFEDGFLDDVRRHVKHMARFAAA